MKLMVGTFEAENQEIVYQNAAIFGMVKLDWKEFDQKVVGEFVLAQDAAEMHVIHAAER
jgi:hypothetical protein